MHKDLLWTLKQLHVSLEQYGRSQMKDLNISPAQWTMLHYLLSKKDQLVYAVDLHTALEISKSTVSSTLKALKKNGFIALMENPDDDRKKQIALLDKAYRIEETLETSIKQRYRQLCKGIPEEHLVWLERDLAIMLSNIQNEVEWEETIW